MCLFGIPAHSHAGVLPCAATGEKKRERRHPTFRTHKNEFYKLADTCRPGDMLEEPPSIPDINNGEFDALHEKGDILGVL